MSGKGKSANYCKPELKDFIDNYDAYYSPMGVSRAFSDKYWGQSVAQSKEAAYKTVCFRLVVGCRVNLCKDYLGK